MPGWLRSEQAAGLDRKRWLISSECATTLLEALTNIKDQGVVFAVTDVFRTSNAVPADDATRRILQAFIKCPHLFRADHTFLPGRLKELLRDGMEPDLVYCTARALVEGARNEIGNAQTAWAGSAGDIIELAISLQRSQGTRLLGTELFEMLLEAEANGVDETLLTLDRNRMV